MEEKKTWKKPELIVIVRTQIEENVLAGCKSGAPCMEGGSSPSRPANS